MEDIQRMSGFTAVLNHDLLPDTTILNKYTKGNAVHTLIQHHLMLGYQIGINEYFVNETMGIYIVFYGEIYNRNELFDRLGETPTCLADCEIIVCLYQRYGMERTLAWLDGAFAFVLYDSNLYNTDKRFAQKIYVARDAMGVRPLYQFTQLFRNMYSKKHGRSILAFAYDSLLLSAADDDIVMQPFMPGTLSHYELSFKVGSEWKSVFENRPYFQLSPVFLSSSTRQPHGVAPMDWYMEGVRVHLEEAVAKRCHYIQSQQHHAGKQVGCMLSDGLKSALVAAVASQKCPDTFHTFSIGFKDSPVLRLARKTAKALGLAKTHHHEIIITQEDLAAVLPTVQQLWHMGDSVQAMHNMAIQYLAGKWIRENTHVIYVLNGNALDHERKGSRRESDVSSMDWESEQRTLWMGLSEECLNWSDRCMNHHGLISLSPWVDPFFVNYYLSIPLDVRDSRTFLRKAFSVEEYRDLLSDSILQRESRSGGAAYEIPSLECVGEGLGGPRLYSMHIIE